MPADSARFRVFLLMGQSNMPIYPRAVFALAAAASGLLSSCTTYDPPPQASKPVPANVDSWQKISTKSWKTPAYEKREEALQMLEGKDWLRIDATQRNHLMAMSFASPIWMEVPKHHQLFLVRGRGYGAAGGKIRFQPKTRELSVFLAAYNGEIWLPGMPNARQWPPCAPPTVPMR